MIKYLLGFILYGLLTSYSLAFDTNKGTIGKDTTGTIKDTVYITYYAGLNYSSNLVFFGRSGSERTPYVSSDFYMQIPAGFWANVSFLSFYSLHSITQIDNIGLTLGYDKKLNKNFGISTSLNRYFYPSSNVSIQNAATNLVDFYLGYKLKFFRSSLGCSYMAGNVNDFFSSFSMSGYFEKNYLFNSNFSILFEPKILINAGTQNFVSVYQEEENKIIQSSGFSKKKGRKPSKGTTTTTTTTAAPIDDNAISKKDFHVLSYELGFPVTISYKRVSLEAAYNYIIPVNLLEGDLSNRRSVFSLSLYYIVYKEKIRNKTKITRGK